MKKPKIDFAQELKALQEKARAEHVAKPAAVAAQVADSTGPSVTPGKPSAPRADLLPSNHPKTSPCRTSMVLLTSDHLHVDQLRHFLYYHTNQMTSVSDALRAALHVACRLLVQDPAAFLKVFADLQRLKDREATIAAMRTLAGDKYADAFARELEAKDPILL